MTSAASHIGRFLNRAGLLRDGKQRPILPTPEVPLKTLRPPYALSGQQIVAGYLGKTVAVASSVPGHLKLFTVAGHTPVLFVATRFEKSQGIGDDGTSQSADPYIEGGFAVPAFYINSDGKAYQGMYWLKLFLNSQQALDAGTIYPFPKEMAAMQDGEISIGEKGIFVMVAQSLGEKKLFDLNVQPQDGALPLLAGAAGVILFNQLQGLLGLGNSLFADQSDEGVRVSFAEVLMQARDLAVYGGEINVPYLEERQILTPDEARNPMFILGAKIDMRLGAPIKIS